MKQYCKIKKIGKNRNKTTGKLCVDNLDNLDC